MSGALHISLSAETIFTVAGIPFTNSMITSLIVSGLIISFAAFISTQLKKTSHPTGWQNFAEWLIESLYSLGYSITGSHKKTREFFPLVLSFFLFIMMNNWFGLLPGVGTIGFMHEAKSGAESHSLVPSNLLPSITAQAHNGEDHTHMVAVTATTPTEENHNDTATVESSAPVEDTHAQEATTEHAEGDASHTVFTPYFRAGTADINTTLALAIISVFATQLFGIMHVHLAYFKKFFNFTSPIMFFVGILELVLEFAKVISFAFRLFGNIFAGEVLLAVIMFLVPVVVPMPFYGLEIFVGFIQALVFTVLSLVFFNMATISHDDH